MPAPFDVVWEEEVLDCDAAEREIHKRLARYRFNQDREFFQLSLKRAIPEVQRVADEYRERERQVADESASGATDSKRTQARVGPVGIRSDKIRSIWSNPTARSINATAFPSRCEHCGTDLPSHLQGLYYSRCSKCGKVTYTKS